MLDCPGVKEQQLLQTGSDRALRIERVLGARRVRGGEYPLVGKLAKTTYFRVRVPTLPDDLGVELPSETRLADHRHTQHGPQSLNVTLGFGRLPAAHHHISATRPFGLPRSGSRTERDGEWIFEDRGRLSATNGVHEILQLRRRQRRRLNHHQHIVLLDGVVGINLDDLVLFLQLFNDQLPGRAAPSC